MLTKEKHIEEVIKGFNFEAVNKTMVALDWYWGGVPSHIPNIEELKEAAKELLEYAYNEANTHGRECGVSSGGFSAWAKPAELPYNDMNLSLQFIPVESSIYAGIK